MDLENYSILIGIFLFIIIVGDLTKLRKPEIENFSGKPKNRFNTVR